MIPQKIIEEIKFRNTIEDVISSYVTLTRAGSRFKGLCPFHSEKTPSFTVNPDDGYFYCFGCGVGGDVITFVMKAENLDYPSALEFLAKRVGIVLPEDDDATPRGVTRTRVIEMNTAAARFFRAMLFDEKEGAAARAYLVNRGLEQSVIKHFGLGFAPNSFNRLYNYLRKSGFTDEEMTEGSLCSKNQKGDRIYDSFRNRVMFPLIDVAGNVVAFGGRVLDDSKPKYLNSRDTPAFKKSKTLFALNFAKNNCSDGLILCEGNVDVVSLHQAGFENAVATLGTAITPEHARLMKKYTERVFIAYDSDGAGKKATERAISILKDVGLETKVISITGAKDPDEYLHRYGKLAFRKLLQSSRSVYDFTIDNVLSKYDISNADNKARAASELCFECAKIYSKVSREIFAGKIAKALSVDIRSVEYDIERAERSLAKKNRIEARENIIIKTSGVTDRVNRDFSKNPRAARLEEIILGMMLYCPELPEKALRNGTISEDDFFTEYAKKLFSAVKEGIREGSFDISMLNTSLTPDEVSRAVKLMTAREKLANTDAIFFDAVSELKKETAPDDDSLEALARKVRLAQEQNSDGENCS